ncbi:MAG: HNH endonuclease signature motif containing protein [Candidatus Peregrinibacteria bacterium]
MLDFWREEARIQTFITRRNMKMTPEETAIYRDFECCGKNSKKWMNKCVLMLPKIEKMRIWEKKGFSSIYEFAAKLAGMNRDKVNEGLRILKRTESMPDIQKVIEKKGIWAVRPIVRVATPENQKFWAGKAETMSKNTLETYVRDIKNQGRPRTGNPIESGLSKPSFSKKSSKITVSMKLDPEVLEILAKLKGTNDWNATMKSLLESHEKETQREQRAIEAEKPEKVKTFSRHVPIKIRKYVKARAGNRCEAPNCTKPGRHLHHTTPFALKKEHDPDKIRFLCEEHHDIAHCGLIRNEDGVPEGWSVIRLPDMFDFKSVINWRVAEFGRGAG